MSTKYPEQCPKCQMECLPNDKPVRYTESWGEFFVRIWNYDCNTCGWTWANEAQRKHNAGEYHRQKNAAYHQSGGWMMNG